MKTFQRLIAALLFLGLAHTSVQAETVFTYQGKLGSAGQPAEGEHDFRFRLFDSETGGSQVGSQLRLSPVTVSNGVFTVQLDFGDAPFNSSPRWLEIRVRELGAASYTTLEPRQRIGAAPFAIETLFVAPGAVDTAALQDNAVTTNKIADGAVSADGLANNAVTAGKISDGAVSTNDLASNAVTTSKIVDGAVSADDLANDAVTTSKIADGAVSTNDLANNAVTTSKIADGAVSANDLASNAVTTDKIADGAVSADGLADNAVTTGKIADGAVSTNDLANNAVTTNKIADGNVHTDDLANSAVATNKLSNQAVTRLKIADDAIGTAQIDDDAVTRSNIAANAIGTFEIENNTVGSVDIRDGSITSDDVDGSIYARKGQVYKQVNTRSIMFATERVSVSCLGGRDLLIQHVCNLPSDTSDITVLAERLSNVETDLFPATLVCIAQNRVPQSAETLSATVWCLSVP